MTTSPSQSDPPAAPPAAGFDWLRLARGLAGAIAGGVVGYFAFYWLYKNGLYALMVPGLLLGLGAGWAARGRSVLLGAVCLIAAAALGVYSEWTIGPFKKDPSLVFFITHLHALPVIKLVMIGLGAAAAFWFGQGR